MELESPVPIHENVYLGCEQSKVDIPNDMIEDKKDFFNTILESTASNQSKTDISGEDIRARGNSQQEPTSAKTSSSTLRAPEVKVRGYEYKMKGHAEQCVERYLE